MPTPTQPARRLVPWMAVWLAACAATPPNPPTVAAAPAATWQAPLPPGPAQAPNAAWWGQFGDPSLPGLIEAARQASPTLASAQARVSRARAAVQAAGAAQGPQLGVLASASSGRTLPGQATSTSLSAGAQASWEQDLMGGVAAGRQAAQARLQGAEAGLRAAQISVAAEVASSHLALRACEAQLVQSRADAASRAETARLTDQSASAGFTAPADAALARASAAQARNQLLAQQAQCESLVKALVELTDLPESTLRQRLAAATAQVPLAPALAVDAVPATLLARRPDIADAAQAVVAAAADRQQSRAREGLQVSLSGNVALASLRSAGVSSQGNVWTLGPLQVSFPLWDGGARAAASTAAQAGYDDARAQYQAQLRRAVREVEVALVALDATAQRERDVMNAARDFEASLRATEARQKGGLASLFDLEAARRNAVLAQATVIELQRERTAAWIALYRATAGEWAPANGPTNSPQP